MACSFLVLLQCSLVESKYFLVEAQKVLATFSEDIFRTHQPAVRSAKLGLIPPSYVFWFCNYVREAHFEEALLRQGIIWWLREVVALWLGELDGTRQLEFKHFEE